MTIAADSSPPTCPPSAADWVAAGIAAASETSVTAAAVDRHRKDALPAVRRVGVAETREGKDRVVVVIVVVAAAAAVVPGVRRRRRSELEQTARHHLRVAHALTAFAGGERASEHAVPSETRHIGLAGAHVRAFQGQPISGQQED